METLSDYFEAGKNGSSDHRYCYRRRKKTDSRGHRSGRSGQANRGWSNR